MGWGVDITKYFEPTNWYFVQSMPGTRIKPVITCTGHRDRDKFINQPRLEYKKDV